MKEVWIVFSVYLDEGVYASREIVGIHTDKFQAEKHRRNLERIRKWDVSWDGYDAPYELKYYRVADTGLPDPPS
jgi:hypothetical protein